LARALLLVAPTSAASAALVVLLALHQRVAEGVLLTRRHVRLRAVCWLEDRGAGGVSEARALILIARMVASAAAAAAAAAVVLLALRECVAQGVLSTRGPVWL
jgi:hypothetical protein